MGETAWQPQAGVFAILSLMALADIVKYHLLPVLCP
jgi:hypothetical protein